MHLDALSWDQVVAIADQAQYIAKRSGDGCVSVTAGDSATPDILRRLSEQPIAALDRQRCPQRRDRPSDRRAGGT